MNVLQTFFDFLGNFWPLVIVDQYDRGCRYWLGRARRKILTPGLYWIVPWFGAIETASIVPAPISTPLLDITLSDGRTLSYSVTAIVRVQDTYLALNEIDDYKESASELIAATMSEQLGNVDAARIDPERRKRLMTMLLIEVNKVTQEYGVAVQSLRFSNFAIDRRSYRVITDTALSSLAW